MTIMMKMTIDESDDDGDNDDDFDDDKHTWICRMRDLSAGKNMKCVNKLQVSCNIVNNYYIISHSRSKVWSLEVSVIESAINLMPYAICTYIPSGYVNDENNKNNAHVCKFQKSPYLWWLVMSDQLIHNKFKLSNFRTQNYSFRNQNSNFHGQNVESHTVAGNRLCGTHSQPGPRFFGQLQYQDRPVRLSCLRASWLLYLDQLVLRLILAVQNRGERPVDRNQLQYSPPTPWGLMIELPHVL